MKLFSNLFTKVRQFFTTGRAVEKAKELVYAFNVTDLHLEQVITEIVEVKHAEVSGSEKTEMVIDRIRESHDGATTLGEVEGIRWPEVALEFLKQIVQIAYLIAKLTGRI